MDAPFVPISVSSRHPDPLPTPSRGAAPLADGWRPRRQRRILCVFPRYTHSFGTFDHAFPLVGARAFMPPQGLLLIAASLPREWEVRFIDENIAPATDADFAWADAVFISGMHVQHRRILDINRRAHRAGRLTVLGGPSVSACPEWYPEVDILHLGELGDATRALLQRLDESVSRPDSPAAQERFVTTDRLPLTDFPPPAYGLIRMRDYFLASVQFSSGCPFQCEFCDIPELYGRNPRLKSPDQVTAELDAILARGNPGVVYFVDDNFIANPRAALALLHALVRWQHDRGYPVCFACEATLNLARCTEILELMREAAFTAVFCGIETPEEDALRAIGKSQNLRRPILDAVRTLNRYGLEVVSGIIMGLDTDTPDTGRRVREFIAESGIPLLTINILHALPRTPLWRRLEAAGRLRQEGEGGLSNVAFLLPEQTVARMWRDTVTWAYSPEAVYARFDHQARHTFPNRKRLPLTRARLSPANLRRAAAILARLLWTVGIRADYRACFWRCALRSLRAGRVEDLIHTAVVAHHLILFARECADGGGEPCFYSPTPATGIPTPSGEPDRPATAHRATWVT